MNKDNKTKKRGRQQFESKLVKLHEGDKPKENKSVLDLMMDTNGNQTNKEPKKGRKKLKVDGQNKEINDMVSIKAPDGITKPAVKQKNLKKK